MNFGLAKISQYNTISQIQHRKTKSIHRNPSELRTSTLKHTVKRMKREGKDWEKIYSSHIKGHIFKYIQNCQKYIRQANYKWAKTFLINN